MLASMHWKWKLLSAAEKGPLSEVKALFLTKDDSTGMGVNVADEQGCTPLINAAAAGHLDIVKYLVEEQHADVNRADKEGFAAVTVAAYLGHTPVVSYLMSRPDYLNPPTKHTPLIAASTGHLDTVKFLVEEGKVDLNEKGPRGYTALMTAAEAGQLDIVAYLIRKGADVDVKNDQNLTVFDIVPSAKLEDHPSREQELFGSPTPPPRHAAATFIPTSPATTEGGRSSTLSPTPTSATTTSNTQSPASNKRTKSATEEMFPQLNTLQKPVISKRDVLNVVKREQRLMAQREENGASLTIPLIGKTRGCFGPASAPAPPLKNDLKTPTTAPNGTTPKEAPRSCRSCF